MEKIKIFAALAAMTLIMAINLKTVAHATGENENDYENEYEYDLSVSLVFDDHENGYYISHPRTARISVSGSNIDYASLVACINGDNIRFDNADSYSSYSESYTTYTEYTTTTYTYTDEYGNSVTETVEEQTEYSEDGLNQKEYVEDSVSQNITCEYSIDFDNDGMYSGYVSVRDTYGREARVNIDEFCIDTTPPDITVSVDDEEYLYTNKERIAHIKIYDANLDGCGEYEYVFDEGEDKVELCVSDKAGNVSRYKGETYIQDYTLPLVYINGIEKGAHYNSNVIMDIAFEDANIDTDNTCITLKGKAGDEYEIYGSLDEEGRYSVIVEDENGFSDDYYELSFEVYDMAGNVIADSYSFTINRRGGIFTISDRIRKLFNTFSDGVSGIKIEENNLSPIDKTSVNIILTKNGRVLDIDYDEDVIIDEVKGKGGYRITYSFNDDLFKDNAVYTISITDKDMAGNVNDTRMFAQTDDITFGVNHVAVLGAKADKVSDETADVGQENENDSSDNVKALVNTDTTDLNEDKERMNTVASIAAASAILLLMMVYHLAKKVNNKCK